tara:strand:- start:201 stop:1406 length:1206 start_codon:yes stop_codon:yes gene_type:complete
MKLFQKLLLAPAVLGLLSPIAASANESNFRAVTNYSQDQADLSLDTFSPLSNKNPLLAGGEGANDSHSGGDFDVDTFSSTTTASFTSNFALGTVEGNSSTDNLGMNFDWEVALSSSFTGNDSLDVVINAGKSALFPELDMTQTDPDGKGTKVQVDTVSYTTSLGDRTTAFFTLGDGSVGSALYNTACLYGAQADTFSDCGVSAANIDEGLGTAMGASFDFENGFSAALAYEGQGSKTAGFLTNEGTDGYGAQVAYNGDAFGVSVSWANIEKHNASTNAVATGAVQSVGLNAYYSPDLNNFPTISAGLESNHDDSVSTTNNDQTSHYFVGIQWDEFGDGTLGAAIGSKEPYAENADAATMYEVFYSYNYADGITVTPLLYSKDNSGSTADETGIIVKTQFSF